MIATGAACNSFAGTRSTPTIFGGAAGGPSDVPVADVPSIDVLAVESGAVVASVVVTMPSSAPDCEALPEVVGLAAPLLLGSACVAAHPVPEPLCSSQTWPSWGSPSTPSPHAGMVRTSKKTRV
ncbi:MAG TPA: hypothetical protein VGB85_02550 [Nannocystis sp.]